MKMKTFQSDPLIKIFWQIFLRSWQQSLTYLSHVFMHFVFPDVSSLFLFALVVLGLGGGDVPLVAVCVWHFSIITAGERGGATLLSTAVEPSSGSLVTSLVLTSTTETWLEESTGSSNPARLPLDNCVWLSVCIGSDWLGLCLGEGRSDSGDNRDLLSSERGLGPLEIGSSSSSFTLSSAETLPDTSSVWSSLLIPFASLLSSSPFSISSRRKLRNKSNETFSPPTVPSLSETAFILQLLVVEL